MRKITIYSDYSVVPQDHYPLRVHPI